MKTPTLVMTGEEDYGTPISESEQFYAALRLLNVDTVLVCVPEEPHGIGRRPSHSRLCSDEASAGGRYLAVVFRPARRAP